MNLSENSKGFSLASGKVVLFGEKHEPSYHFPVYEVILLSHGAFRVIRNGGIIIFSVFSGLFLVPLGYFQVSMLSTGWGVVWRGNRSLIFVQCVNFSVNRTTSERYGFHNPKMDSSLLQSTKRSSHERSKAALASLLIHDAHYHEMEIPNEGLLKNWITMCFRNSKEQRFRRVSEAERNKGKPSLFF